MARECLGGNSVNFHPSVFTASSHHQHSTMRRVTDRGNGLPNAMGSTSSYTLAKGWAAGLRSSPRCGPGFPESHGCGRRSHARLTPLAQATAQLRPGAPNPHPRLDCGPWHGHTCGNYRKKNLRRVPETPILPPSSQGSVSGPRAELTKKLSTSGAAGERDERAEQTSHWRCRS